MDLRDYIRIARKRWWMLLTAVLLSLGIATLVTMQTTPLYATSVTFFITTPNTGVSDAYQGGLFSQQRVRSYQDLLTSDRLAVLVAMDRRLGLTPAEVRERISAEAVPETVLLRATVTDTSVERSQQVATALAVRFKNRVESLETPLGQQISSVKVEVVAGPETSDGPVSPRPVRSLAVAAVLGLLVGLGAAILRELLDTTVKSPEDLQALAGAPVIGGLPFDPAMKSGQMTAPGAGHSARGEALRQLRTNLQYVDVDKPIKTLVVTSAMPGEGKSSTACALAMLCAENGQRVLIMDADLRRPRVADYLGLEGGVGLTTVLAGQAALDDVVQQYGEHLFVLPSGFLPPNPSELLGSHHMAQLLTELREAFDIVVVDCPPLLPVTDAAVVAARTDGALLLARVGKTTGVQVATAVKALGAVDARLLGCVLNMLATKGADAYYYYDEYASKEGRGNHRRRMDGSAKETTAAPADVTPEDAEQPAEGPKAGWVGSPR
ncbi:polysaccharide biosynthesis tyrosine autokinase [Actinoplanes sp. NEAU-A12]|uniref:Polysaccharide biosynthesis tyrosine autokinase n=1 Tax=Actinoplanes sandaracinus TaxID=3045177 RepID=A0ABT6WNL2_9ACTN|nr:polysaccharide biosynthesis tyrosine autokinase [Actinoplanes sandaracinus]MDI6101301.1 polysaccharide biosynthesis tyrosine autokinase [Actinoplanes sandaracinus]